MSGTITGPAAYAAAVRLLDDAEVESNRPEAALFVAKAQALATLALAAATIDAAEVGHHTVPNTEAWQAVKLP